MDPFELPEWLGTGPVTWVATTALDEGPLVTGELRGPLEAVEPLDLLAVDAAYPTPVLADDERRQVHQAWHFGEVLLIVHQGRTTAAAPGSQFDAREVCEVLRRFAKAVGTSPSQISVSIAL